MTPPDLHVVVPGPLEQRTGGYLYDARMVSGLAALGWTITVHNLDGAFPEGDAVARAELTAALESLPDGARVLIDGLAMGGLPEPIAAHGDRLQILGLVHHPLADETGLTPADERRFRESERAALAPCRGVVVTSEYTARRLLHYGVPAARIRAVPPGTEPAPPAGGPRPEAAPCLICVGTVTPRKGHDVLVDALAQVADLPWTAVCAGSLDRDPVHVASVLARVERAGLSDRIEFVGERDGSGLDAVYEQGSLFVLASHYEGYGMALAEALARGLPVLSTTGGAIPFTVPDSAGVLVPPGDPGAFAGALRELLKEGQGDAEAPPTSRTRTELARGALRYAAKLPDWDQAVSTFAEAVIDLAPEGEADHG